jgi:hypothetical protein
MYPINAAFQAEPTPDPSFWPYTLGVDFNLVDDQALVHHLVVDVNAGGIQTRWSALLTIPEVQPTSPP